MPFQPPPEYKGMTWEQFRDNPNNRGKHPSILEAEWRAHVARKMGFGGQQATGVTFGTQGGPDYSQAGDPTGLRAYSQQHGMGTGKYEDFDDATLQSWQSQFRADAPDPSRPFLAFDGSGWVEKPIDSNYAPNDPRSIHRQNTTGGVTRGGGGGPARTGPEAAASGAFNPVDPLQQRLLDMASRGGGFFGENPMNNVASLQGGGIWWGQGGDFSQAFNPLAPRGQSRPQGGGASPFQAQPQPQQNPFQQAAQSVQAGVSAPPPTQTPFAPQRPDLPQYKQDMLNSTRRNPMQDKLFQFYGGQVNR